MNLRKVKKLNIKKNVQEKTKVYFFRVGGSDSFYLLLLLFIEKNNSYKGYFLLLQNIISA